VTNRENLGKRSYDRFCPLSLALDQVGDRWTLHIILSLLSGPKRYSQLKKHLAGAGTNILSERLRLLSANQIVGRTAGDSPGSEITYHLTERGRELGPAVGSLAMWGLSLLWPAPESEIGEREVFDRTWTGGASTESIDERYQWSIDGIEFELAVSGSELIRTRGRSTRPAATFKASGATLGAIVRGQTTVADAVQRREVHLKGSKMVIERMFVVVGFPLARLGF
jgi:DNA-binding HxlR family transcriptional regulator